ncbi:hypothetical protein [Adhaeretor mobilis]|uniref:Uncharacterized protein n=1 Tax=Adhaeretor mobilis TaxID=1930276 RepID=A0A517MS48_9BACT|nr:hypothetical protein [Adhaeretor mobilis]QDS97706.1 hypothetical protein HG15A2_09700 [Adhaeretor mobilis]
MNNQQREFKFTPGHESKEARCQRLLARLSSTGVLRASDLPKIDTTLSAAHQPQAERLMKSAKEASICASEGHNNTSLAP